MHLINQQHGISHLQKAESFTPGTTQIIKQFLIHPTIAPKLLNLPKCVGLQVNLIYGSIISSYKPP